MVLCFPYFVDNFIVFVIPLPSTIIVTTLWDFLNIWIGVWSSFIDIYIEVWLISKEGRNCTKRIEELEIVLEIHLLMFGTLPTYTWKITLYKYKPQGCFQVYGLGHYLHLIESHNVILFNYVTNYAILFFTHFFFNVVVQPNLLVSFNKFQLNW
jgi:hypothetical protein